MESPELLHSGRCVNYLIIKRFSKEVLLIIFIRFIFSYATAPAPASAVTPAVLIAAIVSLAFWAS